MKKINVSEFLSAKSDFLAHFVRRAPKTWEEFNNELSLYCSCFGLPVIVAIEFAKEMGRFLPQLEEKAVIVKEFYNYDE